MPAPPEQWAMPRALRGETSSNVEFRLCHKETGETWWGSYNFAPIKDMRGNITGAVVTAREITERKRAEKALVQSLHLLDTLLASAPLGICYLDRQLRYVRINERLAAINGIPAADHIGKTVEEIVPSLLPTVLEVTNRILATGQAVVGYEFVGETATQPGLTRYWSESWYPVHDASGEIDGFGVIIDDITASKLAEAELNALNEELEQRVAERTAEIRERDQLMLLQNRQAAMGEMLGNIAHQWRQPLNNLGLHIQQLSLLYDLGEFNGELLNDTERKMMNLIKHMSNTIDDFRNFFVPEKEKVEFRVAGAVADSVSLIADALKSKHIEVEVVVVDDPILYGYRNEFAQALLNMLNNAAEALTKKQPLTPSITATVTAPQNRTVVTIRDNAGGVPPEIIERIFDPYFTTKGPHGTGVGLYMSKTIIEKNMGGRLTVCNSAEGAEFKIEV